MDFTIDSKVMADAAKRASAIACRNSVASLACVKVTAESDGTVRIYATDLTDFIEVVETAMVFEGGEALLPAKKMASITSSLPDGAVMVKSIGNVVSMECGKTKFSVPTSGGMDEFPPMPSAESGHKATVRADLLAPAAKEIMPCAAKKDARPALNGILIEPFGDSVRLTATDSYVIAQRHVPAESSDGARAVLPMAFAQGLAGMTSGEVNLDIGESTVTASDGHVTLASALIGDPYPDVDVVVKRLAGDAFSASIPTSVLAGALKRAESVGLWANTALLEFNEGELHVSADGKDEGSYHEGIECDVSGQGHVAVNAAFALRVLGAMGDSVKLIGTSETSPVRIESGQSSGVVMPVRI